MTRRDGGARACVYPRMKKHLGPIQFQLKGANALANFVGAFHFRLDWNFVGLILVVKPCASSTLISERAPRILACFFRLKSKTFNIFFTFTMIFKDETNNNSLWKNIFQDADRVESQKQQPVILARYSICLQDPSDASNSILTRKLFNDMRCDAMRQNRWKIDRLHFCRNEKVL